MVLRAEPAAMVWQQIGGRNRADLALRLWGSDCAAQILSGFCRYIVSRLLDFCRQSTDRLCQQNLFGFCCQSANIAECNRSCVKFVAFLSTFIACIGQNLLEQNWLTGQISHICFIMKDRESRKIKWFSEELSYRFYK